MGFGLRVRGLESDLQAVQTDFVFRVSGKCLGSRVSGLVSRVECLGFRVECLGLRV